MNDPQKLFAVLADPTRRAVFERLTSEGPSSATRLAADLPVSRQAVAKHLTALDEAGLAERTVAGREVQYHARLEPLTDVSTWLEGVESAWESRLENLRRSLE